MHRRRSEPCQNSLCCDVTAQTPLSRLWLELSDTDFHGAAWLPTASGCWFRAAVGDELTELQALRAVCVPPSRGTPASPTVHGTPWIPAPWIPAQQLDSCLLECSNWCFRCKIVWGHSGYLRAKQPPFLVVSLCFFHLPWKAWARQDFVEGWGGKFINGSCAGLIVVLQTSHFIFNNNLRFRQDVYGLLSLLLKDYTSFWMFLL